jgi:G3E family GTPase
VTLLGGFLGAGKTSLLNHLVSQEQPGLVVLVNDFGALNVDAALIVGQEGDTVSLAGGCVCCTVRDDLVQALAQVVAKNPAPRRILVELSGLSEPGIVVRTISMLERSLPIELDGVFAVVDAEQFPNPGDEHYFLARDQLALADVIVLNKIDLLSDSELALLRTRLRGYVPEARWFETTDGRVPSEFLTGSLRNRLAPPHPAEPEEHVHEHAFSSFVYRSKKPMQLELLRTTAPEMPSSVFRMKGWVYLASNPERAAELQVVGRRARIGLGAPWGDAGPETELVVIGSKARFDPEAISAKLRACEAPGPRRGTLSALSRIFQRSDRN